ncbi:MAG: type II toxin-antitoxin system HicA family toxin [Chloroflexota bacterium]
MILRIRALDPSAHVVHQDGSHQKWRLHDGRSVIVPIHARDIPTGTIRSIERQGEPSLGQRWLSGSGRHD